MKTYLQSCITLYTILRLSHYFITAFVGRKAFVVNEVGVELVQNNLDATARRDNDLLLTASSWLPSLRMGMTSASFHLAGNVLVSRKVVGVVEIVGVAGLVEVVGLVGVVGVAGVAEVVGAAGVVGVVGVR